MSRAASEGRRVFSRVGIAQGALDIAPGYATQREGFGASIANLQVIQSKPAEMATRAKAVQVLGGMG